MIIKGLLRALVLLAVFHTAVFAQKDTVQQRIFLIGDAGALQNGGHPVIDWLKKKVNWDDTVNSILYLGDNIYQEGLPMEGEADYEQAKKVIDYQIGLVKGKKARGYIIPGNHDWMNGAPGGFQRATNQSNYINGLGLPNVHAWPLDGCPGPVLVELDNRVIFVFGDSQWFLHLHDKPGPGSGCAAGTIDEFITELEEIIATHPNHLLIFAVHHPFYTYGDHGGDYSWKDHIFPFRAINKSLYIPMPVIGSAYPIARGYFGNIQDIYHPLYRNMINEIEHSLRKHPNPIHVAGHDHGLQFNYKDSMPFIVSGSGSRLTGIKKGKYNVFSELDLGFSMLEVHKSGEVWVNFYDLQAKDLSTPKFRQQLKSIAPATVIKATELPAYKLPDSVWVTADPKLRARAWKRMMLGNNYRDEWTDSIKIEVLDISKEAGGLRPVRQSSSGTQKILTLEDKKGKQWLLRTLNTFPQNIIPSDLRVPLNRYIDKEDVSASYPFASILAGNLGRTSGIPTVRRKVVYIPDDPRLTRFREDYQDKIGILEEKEPVGITNTINTNDLLVKMQKQGQANVDQKKVLRARLLDNFVMDFNRIESQWNWSSYDTGQARVYFPIPLNPSQAFSVNQGVLPWLSQKMLDIPEITGFDNHVHNINSFNRAAYNFDHRFLNALTKEEWEKEIDIFLQSMTDSAIDRSALRYRNNFAKPNARSITNILKLRRKEFKDEMLGYYNYVSRYVTVVGSAKPELYTINNKADGSVEVKIEEVDSTGKVVGESYRRDFQPDVTKEVRMYGLEGQDKFLITGESSPIKVRIIGGPGKDSFVNNSDKGNVRIYDVEYEGNEVIAGKGFISHISTDPTINLYNRLQFKHNYTSPGLSLAYNVDDGVLLGGTVEFFHHGFRRSPYNNRQLVGVQFATQTSSWNFRYEGDFTKALGKYDLIIRGDARAPVNVTNFFGYGTNTTFDDSKRDNIQYYRVRYDVGHLFIGARNHLQSWLNADLGPALQYYDIESEPNENKYLNTTNRADLYNTKFFLGAEGKILINTKNNLILPTRGADLRLYARQVFSLNSEYKALTQMGLDLAFFMSLNPNTRTVLGARFAVKHNIGNFEFPFANYLSGLENLRGYRKDRFAGRTIAFNNMELRVRLAQFRTYLFAGSFGVLAFNDVGRIWTDGEDSQKWHDGYGGGIWISPVGRFVLTGTVAHSEEEKIIPMVTFGFQF